jgi:hypothetical protein
MGYETIHKKVKHKNMGILGQRFSIAGYLLLLRFPYACRLLIMF